MIKIAFTSQGQIIGDWEELEDALEVENPAIINVTPQGVQLVPLLIITESNRIQVNYSDILGGALVEPVPQMRNVYNEQFGSGIQLLTK